MSDAHDRTDEELAGAAKRALSWHLTSDQIADLKNSWPDKPEGNPPADLNVASPVTHDNPGLAERWAWINKFLAGAYDE